MAGRITAQSVRTFMTRQRQTITLSLQPYDKVHLEALALEFGKTWGDRPNISKLIEAIARHQLLIAPNHDWTPERISLLNRIRTHLIDHGEIDLALEIAKILSDRSELTLNLRSEIDGFIAQPVQTWRTIVEQYLKREQPFRLSYEDAAERVWQFTIHHARITPHETRQYLDCWCEETLGSDDIPELQHNRSLRLDRITDAAVSPIKAQWKPDLDTVPVEFHLHDTLAFAYRTKNPRDLEVSWLTEAPPTRRIQRDITSSFWFLREILPYGPDCEIISPNSIRDRLKAKIQAMAQRYTL